MTRDDLEQLRRWERDAAAQQTWLSAASVCRIIATVELVLLVALLIVAHVAKWMGAAGAST